MKSRVIPALLLVLLLAGSCGKEKAPVQTPAGPSEQVRQQREAITEKLSARTLQLHVYKPFEVKYEDFELEDLSGRQVALSQFEGQVIFLNFWATWCPPCRSEMPSMERVYRALKERGLAMVTINLREDAKTVSAFMTEYNLSFPVLLDKAGTVAGVYGAANIPTTYIFDRRGYAVAGTAGTREWDQAEIQEILELLLAEEAG